MRRLDWSGWLKSEWNRSRSSLTRRRLASQLSPRPRYRDLGSWVESLELREMLAAVTWDGGGNGIHWSDALNWSNNVLPGAADDVTIDFGGNTVQHDVGSDTVHSLTTTNPFELAGDTLSVVTTTQVNNSFTLNGGSLSGGTVGSEEKNVTATSTRRSHRQINCLPNFLDTRSET